MALRKTNLSGRKNKKIKSKKIRATRNKLPKRNYKKTSPPKRSRPKKIDPEELEEDEFKEWLGDDVYQQLYEAKTEFVPDFPLEELYYDDREIFSSSEFSDDDFRELGRYDEFNDGHGLKRKHSESNESLVERYLKAGSNHVASFIVESAIRFGQEQGIVVPEDGNKNVYQFTSSPYSAYLDDYDKKIRFRVPSKNFGYEDAKKAMWKRRRQKKPLHLAKSRRFITDGNTSESIREKENFLEMETIGESSSDSDHKGVYKKNYLGNPEKIKIKKEKERNDDYFSESDFADEQNNENYEMDKLPNEKSTSTTSFNT